LFLNRHRNKLSERSASRAPSKGHRIRRIWCGFAQTSTTASNASTSRQPKLLPCQIVDEPVPKKNLSGTRHFRMFGDILLGVCFASNQKRINQRMEYRTDEQIIARGRQIAPLADDDLPPLITLANGVREYCDLMESLMPELGGEIDVTKMSRNMDGDA